MARYLQKVANICETALLLEKLVEPKEIQNHRNKLTALVSEMDTRTGEVKEIIVLF